MAGAASNSALTGSIRWEVDKASITSESSFSPSIDVGGMQWRVGLHKLVGFGIGGSPFLGIKLNDLDCVGTEVHSFDASVEFKLVNHENEANSIVKTWKNSSFKKKCSFLIGVQLIEWNTAIEEINGFIKDNKLTVQVDFSLWNVIAFRKIRRVDFSDPTETSHDITLVIDGEKVYVSKQTLTIYSPVFSKMFHSEFIEKGLNEIELKEINRAEFIELLYIIYPPSKKISEENFNYILELSDRFEIDMVTNLVEQFLIDSTKLSLAAKLIFAERYRLHVLQNHCLDQLKTIKDVKDMNKSEDAKNFSDAIRGVLYNKIMQF